MMLHKLTLPSTYFNKKRKISTSFVANVGPILQRIKRTLSNDSMETHDYLTEYQEKTTIQEQGRYSIPIVQTNSF
jgi:hypothetical protein